MRLWIGAFVLTAWTGCTEPGPGGDGQIDMQVKHHSKPIPFATVFIAYDEREFPGGDPGAYDDHTLADAEGKASFTGLHKGDYYLYSTGVDSALQLPVTGGIGVEIEGRGDLVSTDVPVTEDH